LKNTFNTPCLLILFILVSISFSFSQSGVEYYFEQGNHSYREGEFQQAIEHYQKIIDAGFESGRLYYNIGNCYYKLDEIGYAILYYEKAKKILPNDSEVGLNLELARLKVIDRVEMPSRFFLFEWWDAIKDFYSIPQLTRLTIIFYIFTAVIFVAFLFLKRDRIRRVVLSIFVISLISTLFIGYVLFSNIHERNINQYAILLSQSVNVLSAPEENSTDVFILHEGVKIKLEDEIGDWIKIVLPDGKSGWIKRDRIGII
jgi:tetratricopeptide (TPR) repeat protein